MAEKKSESSKEAQKVDAPMSDRDRVQATRKAKDNPDTPTSEDKDVRTR